MGSIKSEFQFESYKIDTFEFRSAQLLSLLEFEGQIRALDWKIDYGFRKPLYIEKENKYIGGLDIRLRLYPSDNESSPEEKSNPKEVAELIDLKAGIAGVFVVKQDDFTDDQIERLVKLQIPSILLSYLRSAVSNFLCSGGWPHSPLPLINIAKVAKTLDLEITRV